nr:B446 [uncultured bacterium]
MFKNRVPAARFGATGTVLMLALALIVQGPMTSAAAAGQDPVAKTIPVKLPDGTEFTVLTTDEITSKTASEGDQLTFKVAEDVVVDGHVVIAKNALVKGEVVTVKKSGFFGRGGNLGIRIESTVTVDNQKTKLRSAKGKAGDDKTGTTVALVVLFGPLGFLKKGKQAIIKPGTSIKVYTDEAKNVQVNAIAVVALPKS